MSYATQSQLAGDEDFIARLNACAAQEIEANPLAWVAENVWTLAAAPDFDAAYASALAAGIGRPGWDESVITDAMILSAVQTTLAAQASP